MKKLEILGSGCSSCNRLLRMTELAAEKAGIEYELLKVTDINEITKFGVMSTPALAIDGTVVVSGRVPTAEELEELLAG
jgi:small redox-active disulfide protein 2